ncbi:hypothetical protein [Mesorhizobium sp. M0060]|uniref:hypothetical protein n=1 Tax=Mesorhizobium sp. M0060 TaxID=2956866 RepID=UPI003339B66B
MKAETVVDRIVLDRGAYKVLERQRADRAAGEGDEASRTPLRWHGLVDKFARERMGNAIAPFQFASLWDPKQILFAWHVTSAALWGANSGRLVYLYWGAAQSGTMHRLALRRVLTCARLVLVNDEVAGQEVQALVGRQAHRLPMFIDAGFFKYGSLRHRQDFIFCAGSNDRNPEILVALAHRGYSVVWLVNDPSLVAQYGDVSGNLKIVSAISYAELLRLYQTCRVAVMPSLRDIHAAGQTTGLEALACGAPLLISAGRTATIFSHLPTVRVIDSASTEAWVEALGSIELLAETSFVESARWVGKHVNAHTIMDRLASLLDESARNGGADVLSGAG